jgi:HSP20 family protein
MDFSKLAPWNWFKKEEEESGKVVPVHHDEHRAEFPASLHDLHTEFDRLFHSLKKGFGTGTSLFQSDGFKPSLDIASDEKAYSVKVELPGMDVKYISIEFANNTLKVKGEKRQEKEEKDKNFYKIERSYGSFQRILDLPEDSDTDKITSHYKDGVLSVTIPRKILPKKETKKIEIKTEV